MKVLDGTQQVVNDMLRVLHLQVDVRFDDFLQVTFSVLHHDVEGVEGGRVARVQELDQLNDEGVLQFAHEGDFTKDALAVSLVFEDVLHSLDGHFLSSTTSRSKGYFAI